MLCKRSNEHNYTSYAFKRWRVLDTRHNALQTVLQLFPHPERIPTLRPVHQPSDGLHMVHITCGPACGIGGVTHTHTRQPSRRVRLFTYPVVKTRSQFLCDCATRRTNTYNIICTQRIRVTYEYSHIPCPLFRPTDPNGCSCRGLDSTLILRPSLIGAHCVEMGSIYERERRRCRQSSTTYRRCRR